MSDRQRGDRWDCGPWWLNCTTTTVNATIDASVWLAAMVR